jgi:DNA-binding transcriptional MerR regulator
MFGAAQKSPEAFRTISEVAEELDVPQHVLRFWESRFGAVKPLKRGGGRRYYRPEDVDLLRGIRTLLYSDGLTIKGVQKVLRQHGARYVIELGRGAASHIDKLRDGPLPDEDDVSGIPSNVRLFPKTPSRRKPSDAPMDMLWAQMEPEEPDLGEDQRAYFSDLLDELLDLKARLKAARRGP